MSISDFAQHFAGGAAPLWQWQALCQARPVFGEQPLRDSFERLVRQLLTERPAGEDERAELRRRRLQLEQGASPRNLKRGPGGTLDVESLVQVLQLESAARHPQALVATTQAAIPQLAELGTFSAAQAGQLGDAYRFLRSIESGLRLLNTSARHDLPADGTELAQLALLLGHSNPERLREQCLGHMAANRALFDDLMAGHN
jgi:glutamate-ammonia-ligase adenylyltransferase